MKLFSGEADEEAEVQAEAWNRAGRAFRQVDMNCSRADRGSWWPDPEEWREEGQAEAEMWERIASTLGFNARTAKRRDRIAIELAFYAEIGEPVDLVALVARHSYPHKRNTHAATDARRKCAEETRKVVAAAEEEIRRKGGVGRISSSRLARKVMGVGAHGKHRTVSDRQVRRIRAESRNPDISNGNSS